MNISQFTMVGRICADPELRSTQGGTQVCKVRVAVNDNRGDTDHASFFGVTIFGKQAGTLNQYAKKGQLIGFWGRFRENRWETKEAQKRSAVEFIADGFQFGPRKEGGGGDQQSFAKEEPQKPAHLSEDLPF
jgi:single-strand DNA-binding protein